MCATLFNMGHISWQEDKQEEAMQSWIRVYTVDKEIGSAKALDALEGLAGQLGLENGLEAWEALVQKSTT